MNIIKHFDVHVLYVNVFTLSRDREVVSDQTAHNSNN